MEPSSSVPSTHIAKELLLKAHSPSAADAVFEEKVQQRSLFLRPTSPDPSSRDARSQRRRQRLRKAEQKKRRQKPKPLSAKEKRISGIYDIPKEQQKHALYVPLHEMWVRYMWEVLGFEGGKKPYITANGAGSHLASADYHGAELSVVRSGCVGMVGLKGIVLKDTKFTFQIITERNEFRTIPKKHTVFRFEIPQPPSAAETKPQEPDTVETHQRSGAPSLQFELHGSQFEHRATDRATKKFKQRHWPDL